MKNPFSFEWRGWRFLLLPIPLKKSAEMQSTELKQENRAKCAKAHAERESKEIHRINERIKQSRS
jgi:hypothetical protein